MLEISKTIKFDLLDGRSVELNMTESFLQKVRSTLDLSPATAVEERHIKQFLVGAMQNALQNASE